MSETRTQVAIAVVERGGQFLVGTRAAGKSLAGCAEFPGGRVQPGESPADAAVRECLEETGLSVSVVRCCHERLHDYAHGRVHLHFFACRITDTATQPRSPFHWVSREELHTLDFPAANRELLEMLVVQDHSAAS